MTASLHGITRVIVTGGIHKGRRGHINGTFKRPLGVTKTYVYFVRVNARSRADNVGRTMALIDMKDLCEDTQLKL